MRQLTVAFINEMCTVAAREALGPDAPEAEVNRRANAIFAFVYDALPYPSWMRH